MSPSFLTPEGYQKLQEELEYLRTVKRQEVAERLGRALEEYSDLIEDAEYDAAKTEQAFVEGRIRELEALLANARLIENSGKHDVVQIGARVTIQEDGQKPEEYIIVGAAEANPSEGKISNESPLGKALMGHRKGDDVQVEAPGGTFRVRILKVK